MRSCYYHHQPRCWIGNGLKEAPCVTSNNPATTGFPLDASDVGPVGGPAAVVARARDYRGCAWRGTTPATTRHAAAAGIIAAFAPTFATPMAASDIATDTGEQ